MKKLNQKGISFKGNLLYFFSSYYPDKSLAIVCETQYGDRYANITLNLRDYGKMEYGYVALNHDLSVGLKRLFARHFCETETMVPITYGYAKSNAIKLNTETLNLINSGGNNELE